MACLSYVSRRSSQLMTSQWLVAHATTRRCHWLQVFLLMHNI